MHLGLELFHIGDSEGSEAGTARAFLDAWEALPEVTRISLYTTTPHPRVGPKTTVCCIPMGNAVLSAAYAIGNLLGKKPNNLIYSWGSNMWLEKVARKIQADQPDIFFHGSYASLFETTKVRGRFPVWSFGSTPNLPPKSIRVFGDYCLWTLMKLKNKKGFQPLGSHSGVREFFPGANCFRDPISPPPIPPLVHLPPSQVYFLDSRLRRKGRHLLLSALKNIRLQNISILVTTEDPQDWAHPNVTVLPRVTVPQFFERLSQCRYLLLPSTREGSSTLVSHASALGCVPITFDLASMIDVPSAARISMDNIADALNLIDRQPLSEYQSYRQHAIAWGNQVCSPIVLQENLRNLLKPILEQRQISK